MKGFVNVGRTGVFNGIFGNPVVEKTVSSKYRVHFQKVAKSHPEKIKWLINELECGKVMFCPGCGVGSITCHARVIEEEIGILKPSKEKPSPRAIAALRMKQSIAYASIKKVATMLACAGPHDNRIRGMLNHHGATTGRWTASLVQFQNMRRSTLKGKDSEHAYRMICEECSREELEICYGPVLEVIASCIRHFVEDTSNG